jgi:hypothetical protein
MALSFDDLEKQAAAPTEPSPTPNVSPTPPPMSFADLEAQAAPPPPAGLSFDQLEAQHKQDQLEALKPAAFKGKDLFSPDQFNPQKPQSPVGKMVDTLNKPMNFAAGRIASLDPSAKAALNPDNKWTPDIAYHDIVNFYWSEPGSSYKQIADSLGVDPKSIQDVVEVAAKSARLGLGLAADFYGDPLFFFGVNKAERALEIRLPGVGEVAKASLQPAIDAAASGVSKMGQAIEKLPGGEKALELAGKAAQAGKDLVDSFDYRTGIQEIDQAGAVHDGLFRGDQKYLHDSFVALGEKRFTDAEKQVMSRAMEQTENIASGIPGATDKGLPVEQVQAKLRTAVPKIADELKVEVGQDRLNEIADTALHLKRENVLSLSERVAVGDLKPEDLGQKTIENYLVHKMSPEAEKWKIKNPRLAAAYEEARLQKEVGQAVQSGGISAFNTGKFGRGLKVDLEEANQIMKEKSGIADFFIKDPIVATYMKRLEDRAFIRGRQYLDTVAKYGTLPANSTERKALFATGYRPINHPEFSKKVVLIGGKPALLQDVMFPARIADKVGYRIESRKVGMIPAFIDSYNRVFRSTALFKPDYYLENWMDNVMKNYVFGVKIQDYADAAKAIAAKPMSMIKMGDQVISAPELKALVEKWGVNTGGHFAEGLENSLFAGKKVAAESIGGRVVDAAKKPGIFAASVLNGMRSVGERGENFTRQAMFINRLKRGMTPEQAIFDVEKYLFDFKRNSRMTDAMRRYYNPFIQAAIKTAQIAPEMILRRPGLWNFYENNLMNALESAMQDPVGAWAIRELYPDYYKMTDRIAGPLLPGNHWLSILAGAGNPKMNVPATVALGLPGGLGLLNQFMIWDGQAAKQAASTTFLRSFLVFATGKDPFNGKSYDVAREAPFTAKKASAAFKSLVSGAVALPNIERMIDQQLGLGDPNYMTAGAVLALHGSMGKFARVTNLDREYLFRIYAMASAEKELKRQLVSQIVQDAHGNNGSMQGPAVQAALGALTNIRPMESADVLKVLTAQVERGKRAQMAAGVLTGQIDKREILGMLKNLHETIAEVNRNYEILTNHYLKVAGEARAEQVEAIKAETARKLGLSLQ